jgi:hypothetical protein
MMSCIAPNNGENKANQDNILNKSDPLGQNIDGTKAITMSSFVQNKSHVDRNSIDFWVN